MESPPKQEDTNKETESAFEKLQQSELFTQEYFVLTQSYFSFDIYCFYAESDPY